MSTSANNGSFSMNRVRLLSNRYFLLNQKNWLIGLLSAAGILFTIWLIPVIITSGDTVPSFGSALSNIAIIAYMFGGLVIASSIFNELHSTNTCYQFLTLPATTTEKFLSAWLVTSVLYTIAVMLAIFLLSFSVESLGAIIRGSWAQFKLFNPFSADVADTVSSYFLYHSIFFLGAIYFRKNNFLKTVLAYITIVIGLLIFFSFVMLIFGLSYQGDVHINMQFNSISELVPAFLHSTFQILFTLLMLFLAFIQLKRRQIV